MLIFGPGYSASRLAARLEARGWDIIRVSRRGADGHIGFGDRAAVLAAMNRATHILSSVPPAEGVDPVLAAYGDAIGCAPARWVGYLSSTGVYGDCAGAWVDESAPLRGRRADRIAADRAWQALRGDVRIFRLPGIYGSGRSVLDRLRAGTAHRVDAPEQIFSRIHVDDIGGAVITSFASEAGVYNIADDLPSPQNVLVEWAAHALNLSVPPVIALDSPALSPMARAFYAENRRVANERAKRALGWSPSYPDWKCGLTALL